MSGFSTSFSGEILMFSVSYIYLMECRYKYFKPTSADAYFEQPHHQQRARTAMSFSTRQE